MANTNQTKERWLKIVTLQILKVSIPSQILDVQHRSIFVLLQKLQSLKIQFSLQDPGK